MSAKNRKMQFSTLLNDYIKGVISQSLEADILDLEEGVDLDNFLLPDKNGNPVLCKSYDDQMNSKRKSSKKKDNTNNNEANEANTDTDGDTSAASDTSEKNAASVKKDKKIIPIIFRKEVLIALECIFNNMKSFIDTNYPLIEKKQNIIKILSDIEDDFNIIKILNTTSLLLNDKYNLKAYREDEFVLFLSNTFIQKIGQREIVHIFTNFIIMLSNTCIDTIIITRKRFSLDINQFKIIISRLSHFKDCEEFKKLISFVSNIDIHLLKPKNKKSKNLIMTNPKPNDKKENTKETDKKENTKKTLYKFEDAEDPEDMEDLEEDEEDEDEEDEEDGDEDEFDDET